MEIYSENMELLESPDLSMGYLRPGVRRERHPAVEGVREKWHYETVSEYGNGGRDVKRVVDVPGVEAREAWEEEIPIEIYVPYTPEQLEEIRAAQSRPGVEERLALLEKTFGAMNARMQAMAAQMSEIARRMTLKATQEVKTDGEKDGEDHQLAQRDEQSVSQ